MKILLYTGAETPSEVTWPENLRIPVAGDQITIEELSKDTLVVQCVRFSVENGTVTPVLDCE